MAAEFSCFCNYLAITFFVSIIQPSIVVYATNLIINLLIWFVQFVNSCSCWSSVVQSKLLMVRWFMSFVRAVQFYQSVSCSSSAVHGLFRQFGSSCSSVAGSVGSVVQYVRSVLVSLSLTSIPQPSKLNTLVDCWDFLPSLYI